MSLNDGKKQDRPEEPRREEPRRERAATSTYSLQDDAPILGDSLNTDDVKRFVEQTEKSIKANESKLSNNGRMKWTVIGASGNETEYALDAAAIIGLSSEADSMAVVMTLIFTGGKKLPQQILNDNRRNVKYSTVPGDQYDAEFKKNLSALIKTKKPEFFVEEIVHIGALPVVESDLSDERLTRIGNEAINQVNAFIRQSTTADSLTIDALDLEDRDLIANIAFHRGDVMDPVTEAPHRADISIDLELVRQERGRDKGPVNALAQRRDLPLAKILSHVDIYYMGPAKTERRGLWSKREERPDTQIYGLNLIISKMQHNQTIGQMVLALAQIPALKQEDVLVTGLRPGGQNQDLRSYKALGFEINADLEEIPEQLSDTEWLDMCSAVLREDGQMVSIQIPRAGISTATHSLLVNACNYNLPDDERLGYADMLIDAANALTGDRFSKKFGKDDNIYDIGTLNDMPVLLGTWRDERGQVRDLREIGYYEILTHYGEKDAKMVGIWEECMFNTKIDIAERLEQMEIIIADYTGGQYKLNDRADNVELNVEGWLYKLTDACREAGMVVLAEGITQDTSAYRRGYEPGYRSGGYQGNAFKVRQRGGYGFGRG